MTNDIIGSIGIVILAIIFMLFVANGNIEILGWQSLANNSQQQLINNHNEPMAEFLGAEATSEAQQQPQITRQSVVTQYTDKGEDCQTTCKILWQEIPPQPYLQEQLTEKYKKKYLVETQIGQYFLWPEKKEKYQYITNADAVVIESVHDVSGRTLKDQRNQITKALKKLDFKLVKKDRCLVEKAGSFADCLDFYERGKNEKCLSVVIYEPINPMDVAKVEKKVIQTKVLCGEIAAEKN